MGFADWKKRSEAFKNVMVFSEVTERNIERACAAAYKAGEREGCKQAEAVASNAVELALLVEREQCATTCDMLAYECRCSLRTKLVGDGCEVCNPEYAAEVGKVEEVEDHDP